MGKFLSRPEEAAQDGAQYDVIDSRTVQAVHPPRFPAYNDEARAYMQQHGYVVIADVVSREEIERAKDLFWQHVTAASPNLRREDVSTWIDENWIADPATGIVHTRGIGHSEFVWSIRDIPKVRQTFAELWETDKLLVSFDRANIFRPWHAADAPADWKTKGGWWHVDQSPLVHPGLDCVQGLVNLYDADETTGGFCVIPGSVNHFSELQTVPHTRDFVAIPRNHSILNTQGQLICHRAGDLVLWDSRTAHCNHPAVETPRSDPNEPLRLTVYVCMTPFSKASAETINRRKLAYKYMMTTYHWPHEADYYPPEDGDPDAATNPLRMTTNMRELVGYYDDNEPADASSTDGAEVDAETKS